MRPRTGAVVALAMLVLVVGGAARATTAWADAAPATPPDATVSTADGWRWPLAGFRLERAYVAPPHRYGPGHRGIDLRPVGDGPVLAPAGGVIAFAGGVAGRAIVTIDHGGGLVTTLEPVDTTLQPGTAVGEGDEVGTIALGGHTSAGALHFGVRLAGEYINPLLLLGGVPRAILLPCC